MPDQGRRVEADAPAALLDPPADIDVVAGDAKARIEAVESQQALPAKSHVATRDVLGLVVREQDMDRATGCIVDAGGERAVAGRGEVWSARRGGVRAPKYRDQVPQPVWV